MDFKFGHTYIKPIRLIPNWSLMEDNRSMVFRIPVDNIPDNEVNEYLRRIVSNFREPLSMQSMIEFTDSFGKFGGDIFLPTRERNPDIPDMVFVDHISLLTP